MKRSAAPAAAKGLRKVRDCSLGIHRMTKPSIYRSLLAAAILLGCGRISFIHSGEADSPHSSRAQRDAAGSWYATAQKLLRGEGVQRDETQAAELLEKAATAGHADAWAALGYCYSSGTGIVRDDAEARRCFERGAALSSAAAKSNLGAFLVQGRGGPKDAKRGVELMEEAIAGGSTETALRLGEIYYFGQHAAGQPDYQRAHQVLLAPAHEGNAAAQNMLGVILKDGRLGEVKLDEARVWLEKAALQGNGKACHNLAELWNHRSPDRWARIEALRWLVAGQGLGEALARIHLSEIRPHLAADELEIAQDLAEITLREIAGKRHASAD